MATVKISALTAAGALTGAEKVAIVQGGSTVRTTAQDIANLAGGGGSVTSTELSNTASVLSAAIKVVSDAVSNEISVRGVSVQTASAAATSVDSRVNSVNTFVSGISSRSVGGVSTHGLQSVIDALSGVISNEISARAASVQTASAAATSVDSRVNTVSNLVSVLSDRVTSVSAQIVSVDAHANAASGAATSVDGRVNSVNVFISGISARSVGGISTHGFQSVIDALSSRISAVTGNSVTSAEVQTASAAATSVNSRVNSVNTFISGISARSTGNVSTHGFQSVVNALSNNISIVSNAASAADAHASVASLAATSADGHANTVSIAAAAADSHAATASLAATSVDSRVNSVNTFISGISVRSVGGVSTHGFQSVVNALSNNISIASAAATSADGHAAAASAAATSVDARVNTVSNIVSQHTVSLAELSNRLSGVSTRSVGVSVKGLQSALNGLSNTLSNEASARAASAQTASAAATSVDGRVTSLETFICTNLSARTSVGGATSIKGLQSVVNALSTQISNEASIRAASVQTASAAATSIDGRVNSVNTFISGISSRSTGNVSTHGFQSVINALSNNISIVSHAASVADAHASVASLAATSADGHANTASNAATSIDGRVNSVNTFISGISSRSVGGISTHGFQSVINALSNRISAAAGGSVTSAEVQIASAAATSVDGRVNSVNTFLSGISSRSVGGVSTHGMQSVVNALSNRISALIAGVTSVTSTEYSVRSVGDVSTRGFQSVLNALSTKISDAISVGSNTASIVIAQIASVDSRVNSVNTTLSGLSVRSVGGVSTHGLQSVLNALSNRISAGGGTASATSQEVSTLVQTASAAATSADAHANTASAAATSVDSRVNSVNTFLSGVSTRSAGNISTHGVQSTVDALSNRLSIIGAPGSVNRVGRVTGANVICAAALTGISGLTVSVSAGVVYEVNGFIMYSVSAATGNMFGLTFPAMTAAAGQLIGDISTNAAGASSFSVLAFGTWDTGDTGSNVWSQAVVGAGTLHTMDLKGIFVPSATGAAYPMARASVATNTVTIVAGSYFKVVRLS